MKMQATIFVGSLLGSDILYENSGFEKYENSLKDF